jgi:serine/threonine-protein kinase
VSAEVVLKVIRGPLRGKGYRFGKRALCVVGRAEDCKIRLPDDAAHRSVSRHHCLLDVDPPCVWVQDFGSRNGTYVNEIRVAGDVEAGLGTGDFPRCAIGDGDRLRVGQTVFRVHVLRPALCTSCGAEIAPSSRRAPRAAGHGESAPALCERCRRGIAAVTPAREARPCISCGRLLDALEDAGADGPGLCEACRSDPRRVVELVIARGQSLRRNFAGVRGYRLVRELGRHPNCAVFLARDSHSLELVALKVLFPPGAGDRVSRLRFLREAQNVMVLRHPNVVQLRDAGWSEGAFYFALEYCEGGTVAGMMKERGRPLTLDEAAPLVLHGLEGLEYCHTTEVPFVAHEGGEWSPGRGLVHRDVKPSNLFLAGPAQRRVVKLGDFGLAKAYDKADTSSLTLVGMLSGTPYFMPRQQVLRYKFARPEVDVWAMAASLYYLLTGLPPRDFGSGQSWLEVVLESPPVPIRRRLPTLPGRVAELIDFALTERPEIPIKSAAAFKEALQEVL